jgi:DNA-binding transcriptional ArsR family regulator
VAEPTRGSRGTFATAHPRDERAVREIVKGVGELAAEQLDKDPADVTQEDWNAHRHLLIGYGPIPKIHGLLAQIPDRHGKPYRYRKLLRDLFDPDRSFEHVARERVGADDWPDLDRGHIDYALNRAADHAGVTTFNPSRYDVICAEIIGADRRRYRTGGDIAKRLPTSEQIIRFYEEDWNRALAEHGLDPQEAEGYRARAVRTPEAIRRFYEKTGYLPTEKKLTKFARYFQFSHEDWKLSWEDALDAGRTAIADAGMSAPPPYRPRQDKPVWEDEQGSRPWDASDARYRPKLYWKNEAMVLVKIGEFLKAEVGPGRPASQDRYQDWSARSPDRPSLMVVQSFGGLRKLVAKVTKVGELERARMEARGEIEPTADELAAKERERLADMVAKPQARAILKLISERGEAGGREIEAALGWAKMTANNWLPYLREAGEVVCSTESPVARNVRYRLPGELTAEQQAAAELRRKEELLEHPNGQATWKLLQERGEVTPAEVVDACGFSDSTARQWLKRLVELGYATRRYERPGQRGGRTGVYRRSQRLD